MCVNTRHINSTRFITVLITNKNSYPFCRSVLAPLVSQGRLLFTTVHQLFTHVHQLFTNVHRLMFTPSSMVVGSAGQAPDHDWHGLAFTQTHRKPLCFILSRINCSEWLYSNNVTKQLEQKQISVQHLIFHRLSVVFVAWKSGLPRKFSCCVLS